MGSASSILPAGPGTPVSPVNASLAEVFDLAPSFLAVLWGPDHIFDRVNQAYLELVGNRDLIGLPVRDALPEVVDQGLITILDRVYHSGEPFTTSERPVRLDRNRGDELEERFVTFVYQPLRGDGDEIFGVAAHGVDVTEHVRDRDALEARESYFRSLIEYSEDKISMLAEDGTILYQNPAGYRLLGWGKDEVIGRSVFDFIHPEDRGVARRRFRAALKDPERPSRLEYRLLHKDGSWRVFETAGQARRTEGGVELVTSSRDVTVRRTQEAELETLVELMPQIVWATTPEGYHDFFNQRWYDYTGMERSGDQGWNWKDYLHPDDYGRSLEVWHHSLATGEPYEIEYRFRRASDGAYRWFIGRAHPLRDPRGQIVRWFGTCTDVHDERMALEIAEQSQERFRAVTSATKDIVWDWDLATGKVWRNENVEKVLGIDPERLAREKDGWSARIHPEDRQRVLDGMEKALQGERDVWTDEYRFIRGDGSTAYLLDRGRTIRSKSGEPIRMIGSTADLTERNRLEAELRQAQKMEAIGKLAGGIAHDFNNLLTAVEGHATILLDDLPADSPFRDEVGEILKAGERAADLTRQLLAFSRQQVLEERKVDLGDAARELEKLLCRLVPERIRFRVAASGQPAVVRADPGQVQQIVMNLVVNAVDAIEEDGSIAVDVDSVELDSGDTREIPWNIEPGPYVRLSVQDTGSGMSSEVLKHVFEPFFTTKREGHGTGLGLATVYGIVKQSGGHILVESELGRGTTFRVLLPRIGAEADQLRERPAMVSTVEGAAVLLVEDDEAVRTITRRILARSGYTVVEAASGREALELADRGIDLVISDVVMPGMGGPELQQRLAEQYPNLKVILTSGYSEAEVKGEIRQLGADFLPKPFTPQALIHSVREVLGRESQSG